MRAIIFAVGFAASAYASATFMNLKVNSDM